MIIQFKNNLPKSQKVSKKEKSGNIKGKPKGALNHATRAALAMLDGECENITRKAIDCALAGDSAAIRLVLERLIPIRKELPIIIKLPPMANLGDLAKANKVIFQSISEGSTTIGQASKLLEMVEMQRNIIETVELAKRIEALEAKANKQ